MRGELPVGTFISSTAVVVDQQHNVPQNGEYNLDEALEATKMGKFQKILIILSGLSIMGAALENVNISYVLPYAKCDLKLTLAEQGVLSSVSYIGMLSTAYFWGFLTDTMGRQKILCTAAFGGFFFSFISSFVTNTYGLIALRFLCGAFLAGSQASAYSYVSEFHTSKTAGQAVAYSSVFLNALVVFLSLAAIIIIPMDWNLHFFGMDFRPWRLLFICTSLLNLWNGLVFAILPESPKFLLAINEKEKALQVLKRVYAFNTGQPEQSYPVKSIKADNSGNNLRATKGFSQIIELLWSQTRPIFLPPLLTHTWKLGFVIFVIFAIGHGTFMWFPDFLFQLQNYNGSPEILCSIVVPKPKSVDFVNGCENLDNKNLLSYQILLVVGVFFFISSVLSSFLMKKISPKKILSVWLLLSALTCFALNALTEFNSIVISFIIFLSCCSCANIVMAVAVNLFPTSHRGMATSFIFMLGRLGGFAGSNLVGALLTNLCTSIFYFNGGLLISCGIVFLTITAKEKCASEASK